MVVTNREISTANTKRYTVYQLHSRMIGQIYPSTIYIHSIEHNIYPYENDDTRASEKAFVPFFGRKI